MGCCFSLLKRPRRSESIENGTLTYDGQAPDVSEPHPGCKKQKKAEEETLGLEDQLRDAPSSGLAGHADNHEETVITRVRATDVTVGLRRLPAGFFATVRHSDYEWRTTNFPVSMSDDVVELQGPIPIPSDLSAVICLGIHASFEFQPMLGDGEQLRNLTITVEELLERSADNLPFTFFPETGDEKSPCSSVLVTVKQRKCEISDSSISRILEPCCSVLLTQLEEATNKGHTALSRYRKYKEKSDLEYSIQQFERALNICTLDHPCRAAAESNMATATFIHSQLDNSNLSLDVPITLYQNALAARLVGHPDRPSTLIHLATVHFARFEKRGNEVDAVQAEGLLREAIELSSGESHERRAAISLLQLHTEPKTSSIHAGSQSSVKEDAGPSSADEDPIELLNRFQRFGDLGDLQRAISHLEASVRSTSDRGDILMLGNLGIGLMKRFDCLGELSDLERGISMLRDTIELIPDGQPTKSLPLSNLGNALLTRFERLGELHDLEEAIRGLRDAVDLTSDGRPHKPVYLSNLGNAFLARFHHLAELGDLGEVISSYKRSVDLTPDNHPTRPNRLNSLGNALKARFERVGDLSDLEEAISSLGDAVELTPDGNPHKSRRLVNLGNAFRIRFRRLGDLDDLRRAISYQSNVIDLASDGQPEPTYLNDIGNSFLTRFQHLGDLPDLEQAILMHRDAVERTPNGHPDKPGYLNNLGNALLTRFERLREMSDLQQAISRHGEAIELVPDGHPRKPDGLNCQANALLKRFEILGELNDIEQAISRYRDANVLTPDGHPDKPGRLNNLGAALKARFRRLGDLSDLEQTILMYGDAVDLTPDGHTNKPIFLNNLGNAFEARYERIGELDDLEQAIRRYRTTVDLTPDSHPDKPSHLNNLGDSFLARFERLGEPDDLAQAISRHSNAIDLIPDGHPNKPSHLNNLGACFTSRFKHSMELSDIEQAILRYGDAVELTPLGNPNKAVSLNNLGGAFFTRFEHLGELGDLQLAISKYKDAVDLVDHPDRSSHLNNLGNALRARFEHLGELSDLEQAISRGSDAAELIPDGNPNRAGPLNNLGNAFRLRFEHLGVLSDLEQAISKQTGAVDLTPDDDPDKPLYLSNLGNVFEARFKRLGELNDLEQANSKYKDAVDSTPDSHPDKPYRLNNLGNNFLHRFRHLGELSDLEQAISGYKDAVDLTPDRHIYKPIFLNNLGNTYLTQFQRLGKLSDLEQAISTNSRAVELTPDGHPNKPVPLDNLGNAFLSRFEHLGELSDLYRAISVHMQAVELSPDSHPDKPMRLSNLGNSLLTRFERLGEPSDLESAVAMQRNATNLMPDGHPDKPFCLNNLGSTLLTRFERLGDLPSLEQAISLCSQAACASTGPTTTRFRASQKWISCARVLGHDTLLHAYSTAITLLPQLAWIGLSLTHRYRELKRGADVVREAAAAALDAGQPETAVEWLEQGRSIVWGELFQLRSSYEELESVHPDHAYKLRQCSTALEHASAAREKSSSLSEQAQGAEHRATGSLEQEANKHRTLAIERDNLLREIRTLPGFERFLLHKEFSQLRAAAHSGPVVILNAAEKRCDALIVRADMDHVIHVPLPNFTLKRSVGLQSTLKSLLGTRVIRGDEREGKATLRPGISWELVLSMLWKDVVKPILDALEISTLGDLSRIFWCPTGPFAFLPIHAAGLYSTQSSEPGNKASDFVISSYVPTLSILVPSLKSDVASSNDLRLLTVGQPLSDGQFPLPGVEIELNHIRAVIQNAPSARTTLLESKEGTVEEVLNLMKDADWVHFSCHGIQDTESPTDSGLCLADRRRLKLSDIIALSRSHGGLAFLSACQTATGDKELSDEAIHIAAGMLFAGYGSVIGTMWSISDRLAPRVARDVYENLFRSGKTPDCRDAARALHDAVGCLRESNASFVEWLPFIHVGL